MCLLGQARQAGMRVTRPAGFHAAANVALLRFVQMDRDIDTVGSTDLQAGIDAGTQALKPAVHGWLPC